MHHSRILTLLLPLTLLLATATDGRAQSGTDEAVDWETRTGFQLSTWEDIAAWGSGFGQFLEANAIDLAGDGDNDEVGVELFEKFFVSADDLVWMVRNSVPEDDREMDPVIDEEELLDEADDAVTDVMWMMAGVRDAGYDLDTVRYETFTYEPTGPDDWASFDVGLLFSCRSATTRAMFSLWVQCCEVRGALKLWQVEDTDIPDPLEGD
ncbi:hypothetical protein K8I85_00480 [bacterium]|nr:hypothetical protein [bacterium]